VLAQDLEQTREGGGQHAEDECEGGARDSSEVHLTAHRVQQGGGVETASPKASRH